MIQEQYVSFETAKLLKEKGFNEKCWGLYASIFDDDNPRIEYEKWTEVAHNNQFFEEAFVCSAPTQQMAMRWLREVHNLHVQVWILTDNGYWYDIEKILDVNYNHKPVYSTGLCDIYYKSYEEACEAAIKYCLENLI